MNPTRIFHLAGDVVREAFANRYLIVLFGIIVIGLLGLVFALDVEVVDGAIAAGKVFGANVVQRGKTSMPTEDFLGPFLEGAVLFTFFGGLLFLILAVSDIAPKQLAPGRVELLLSLPITRAELVVGTYLGVLFIAALAATTAVGGATLVLFAKTGFFTVAPLLGAGTGFLAFGMLYAVMLAMSAVARSPALAAGSAVLLYVMGIATSHRLELVGYLRGEITRKLALVILAPLPRLLSLANIGADVTRGRHVDWTMATPTLLGCMAFGGFALVVAIFIVSWRDY